MNISLTSGAFVVAFTLAALMGFAIQRGATCTVVAVHEWVSKRRVNRLLSMVEASLWVAAGLIIAQAWGWLGKMPSGFALSWATIVGSIMLGVGAYVNQGCVFGAIARLGSGEVVYLISPVGFYAGCVIATNALPGLIAEPLAEPSAVFKLGPAFGLVVIALLVMRLMWPLLRPRVIGSPTTDAIDSASPMWRAAWSPHVATAVIGVTFLFLLVLMGAWAYTDVLAELARAMNVGAAMEIASRGLLLLALFLGAVAGGIVGGRFRIAAFTARQLVQRFVGSALMGGGSILIPGSNDGLLLLGMPLLWPYAWVAVVTMCVSIATSMMLVRRVTLLRERGFA